jgi:hypothetical protein
VTGECRVPGDVPWQAGPPATVTWTVASAGSGFRPATRSVAPGCKGWLGASAARSALPCALGFIGSSVCTGTYPSSCECNLHCKQPEYKIVCRHFYRQRRFRLGVADYRKPSGQNCQCADRTNPSVASHAPHCRTAQVRTTAARGGLYTAQHCVEEFPARPNWCNTRDLPSQPCHQRCHPGERSIRTPASCSTSHSRTYEPSHARLKAETTKVACTGLLFSVWQREDRPGAGRSGTSDRAVERRGATGAAEPQLTKHTEAVQSLS